jgi:hypothetical protein
LLVSVRCRRAGFDAGTRRERERALIVVNTPGSPALARGILDWSQFKLGEIAGLILVKGTDYQDQLEEISYRIRALDPDVMSDDQYDAQLAKLRAERDRLKALPAVPDRWEEQLTGDLYSDIYDGLPAGERGAWLKSHGFVIHATKTEVSVIQGDVRGTAHLG